MQANFYTEVLQNIVNRFRRLPGVNYKLSWWSLMWFIVWPPEANYFIVTFQLSSVQQLQTQTQQEFLEDTNKNCTNNMFHIWEHELKCSKYHLVP